MVTQLLRNKQEEVSTSGAMDSLRLLVQKIVRQVADNAQSCESQEPNGHSQEIVLDMEIDGIRCLLIRSPQKPHHPPVTLSPREYEIVRMVAEGHPNKTIAAVLDISSWTVGTHLRRVFAKLGVGSRAAMVARLLEGGLMVEQLRHSEVTHLRRKNSA